MRRIPKIVCGAILVLLMLLLAACNSNDSWKLVEIEGYGSIKVPKEWIVSVSDGHMYFSMENSGNNKNILVQYRSSDKNENEYFSDVKEIVSLQGEVFSNSAGITQEKIYYQDGTSAELFVLWFTGPYDYESTEFICVDSTVSEKTLRKIARSFVMKK